jgi:signal transduction histidine kinase
VATALRKTGISVVGDVPWGSHFCHFYETKQDLLDTLVPYFKAGLESKEFCLWVVTDPLAEEEARRALRKAVPDLDEHLLNKDIEIFDDREWYLTENVFSLERVTRAWYQKLEQALARGYGGLRVSGDTFWLRENDRKDFCDYEKQLNDSITDQRMTLLCTYPMAKSGAAEILDVVKAHQFAIARRRGEWEVIQSPEPIQAKAEIRRLNEELQRVPDRTPQRPAILRYGVAVLSVIAALITARLLQIQYGFEPFVPFICAMMFTAWFGGVRPGLLALAMSLLAFHYYFLIPIYPLGMEKEIPRLVVAALTSLFVVLLSAAQGNAAESLRRARDVLYGTVQELKRTNVALQAENAERRRAEEQLNITSEQLRALSARLSSAREEEGARIARELHDELGSALTSLKWDLEGMLLKLRSEPFSQADYSGLQEKIKGMVGLVDDMIGNVRRISSELRPSILDDLGLIAAIEWQAKQFESRSGIICKVDSLVDDLELNREQSTAFFRILQEALTNILRHAQASRVNILVEELDGELVLEIRDDGRGITEEEITGPLSLGLIGMRERTHLVGGRIEITGTAGRGTVLTLRVPIPDGAPIE